MKLLRELIDSLNLWNSKIKNKKLILSHGEFIMNDVQINLKDLEDKVNKKNKYLTDFLTPLDVKK